MNYSAATSAPRENNTYAAPSKMNYSAAIGNSHRENNNNKNTYTAPSKMSSHPTPTLGGSKKRSSNKNNGRNNRRPSTGSGGSGGSSGSGSGGGSSRVTKRMKSNGGVSKNMPPSKKNNNNNKPQPMELEPQFAKLNQSDPAHARRIQQRRKTVAMGKNTLGYAEYTKQVPKQKRRTRSMETPSTPDHTLDIPTKRWQGMIKAWRKSLHNYDPADLVVDASFVTANSSISGDASNKNNNDNNVQSREIEHAIAQGIMVDVSTPPPTNKTTSRIASLRDDDDFAAAASNNNAGDSPFSVLSEASPIGGRGGANNMLEDLNRKAGATAALRWGDEDSDDDDDLL